MLRLAQAGLTVPAVVSRGLSELLGHTVFAQAWPTAMTPILPETERGEGWVLKARLAQRLLDPLPSWRLPCR